jgi:4-hydroxy-tetrahydrodipicolinate reductase
VIRIGVNGAAGRMGVQVRAAVAADSDAALGSALERPGHPEVGHRLEEGVELSADVDAALSSCDVMIDFSLPLASVALAEAAAKHERALVIATTGFNADQLGRIRTAATRAPVILAPNFSLGMQVLVELVELAAQRLADYDLEVLELHHGAKVDAPSGTALRLAEAAAEARGQQLDDHAVFARHGHTGPRRPGSIGLQTLRAGSSPGEHTVFLAGPGERIELTHRALSREGFASGSVRAAHWLVGRPPGLYTMRDAKL